MSITAGTDVYGKVKEVGGTSIVTKFGMLQFLPIYPLKSFYFLGKNKQRYSGVPFVADQFTSQIEGVPLARIDRSSVITAYLRGVFSVMVLLGIIAAIGISAYIADGRLPLFGRVVTIFCSISFLIGSIGGLLSYQFPRLDRRERRIRLLCGEILDICADPAFLQVRTGSDIEEQLKQLIAAKTLDISTTTGTKNRLLAQLIATRCRLARAMNIKDIDAASLEQRTNELLKQLSQFRAS